MAMVLPAIPLIAEAIKDALIIAGIVTASAVTADQIKKARDRAQENTRADAAATTCTTCGGNPCAALAGGNPTARYKGGAHGMMKLPPGDGLDSHHMPAKKISPLPEDMGPAIKMDPADHQATASWGRSHRAELYRAAQQRLIAQKRFTEAFAMDVADVKSKFGNKYDGAIASAAAYLACLKKYNLVQ